MKEVLEHPWCLTGPSASGIAGTFSPWGHPLPLGAADSPQHSPSQAMGSDPLPVKHHSPGITGSAELEGTHQDYQVWLLAPSPTIPPCGWEPCPNTSWALPGWCWDHFPGELFWVKCLFLIPNLNLPWQSFRPFPRDLSLLMRVERSVHPPLRRML